MKTVMNQSHDGWLLKMISRTDPVILRKVFDWYQGGREGITTVNAELYGYAVLGYNTTAQKILRQLKRR